MVTAVDHMCSREIAGTLIVKRMIKAVQLMHSFGSVAAPGAWLAGAPMGWGVGPGRSGGGVPTLGATVLAGSVYRVLGLYT